jgi:hypothetical protein
MIIGYNIKDRFSVAQILERAGGFDEYQPVGTIAIDTRQISIRTQRRKHCSYVAIGSRYYPEPFSWMVEHISL